MWAVNRDKVLHMYTVHFDANGLRPDFARFRSDVETAAAVNNLINKRFAGLPLRIRVRHKGETVYTFDRRAAGES